jgi:hypothetical protein
MYLGFDDSKHWIAVYRCRMQGAPPLKGAADPHRTHPNVIAADVACSGALRAVDSTPMLVAPDCPESLRELHRALIDLRGRMRLDRHGEDPFLQINQNQGGAFSD